MKYNDQQRHLAIHILNQLVNLGIMKPTQMNETVYRHIAAEIEVFSQDNGYVLQKVDE